MLPEAKLTNMESLRKVLFTLERFHGTIGDYESAGDSAEEIMKQREGYFHTWGNVPFWDAQESKWRDHIFAIVEESDTGKVYNVKPEFLTFCKD